MEKNLSEKIKSEIIRAKDFVFTPRDLEISKSEIAPMIDHTLLSADATAKQIESLCVEAINYKFYSVCVNPFRVSLAVKKLERTNVKVTSVVGFPFGATSSKIKAEETKWTLLNGADEFDMVINIGALKDLEYEKVFDDIKAVVEEAKGRIVKVIVENALLNFEEKVAACVISKEAGAKFVKTSTGYSKSGAVPEDVALMRFVVGDEIGVKAAGGIHTYEDAVKMIRAGANRIGASHSVEIVTGD